MGVPEYDDRALFECLNLEGAQAGLSWITVLRKREHYRKVFDGFDAEKIVRYDDRKVAALLQDAGIIRNRLKVAATIGNARSYLALRDEGLTLSDFLWDFVDGSPQINHFHTLKEVPAVTPVAEAMSKALKNVASNLSALLSSMPSCRPPAWSTITSPPARGIGS